jgi:hypothetical protein
VQIREIIEYKYSSPHQKFVATRNLLQPKERKGVFVSILANQEKNTKISRTHPRMEGVTNLDRFVSRLLMRFRVGG